MRSIKLKTKGINIKYIFLTTIVFLIIIEAALLLANINLNNKKIIDNLQEKCSSEINWSKCYGIELAEITKKNDLDNVLDILNTLQSKDIKTRQCHVISHYISQAEIEKNPEKWLDLIGKVGVTSCDYGFTHGTIEGLSRFDSNFIIGSKSIPMICDEIKKLKTDNFIDDAYSYNECGHIMGHLLLAQSVSKTVDEGIEKASSECSKIPDTLQYGCYTGVFMENFIRENMVFHWDIDYIPWNDETIKQQEELCFSQTGTASVGCWNGISLMYTGVYENEPDIIFEACSRAPNWESIWACYNRASAVLISKDRNNKEYYGNICKPLLGIENYYSTCVTNLVYALLNSSTQFSQRVIDLCQTSNEDVREECYQMYGKVAAHKYPSMLKELCNNLPSDYHNICLEEKNI